ELFLAQQFKDLGDAGLSAIDTLRENAGTTRIFLVSRNPQCFSIEVECQYHGATCLVRPGKRRHIPQMIFHLHILLFANFARPPSDERGCMSLLRAYALSCQTGAG